MLLDKVELEIRLVLCELDDGGNDPLCFGFYLLVDTVACLSDAEYDVAVYDGK